MLLELSSGQLNSSRTSWNSQHYRRYTHWTAPSVGVADCRRDNVFLQSTIK